MYARRVSKAFGKTTAVWYILFQASQFHIIFYVSRTLPNMFAFGISESLSSPQMFDIRVYAAVEHVDLHLSATLAFSALLPQPTQTLTQIRKQQSQALYLLTLAGIIFRSEIALLLMTQTLFILLHRPSSANHPVSLLKSSILAGLAGALVALPLTVLIDSFFWQRWPLWPELAAFWYNAIEGKSSDWGTSPWHFYFTSAVPRLLLNPLTYLLCIPYAIYHFPTRNAATPLLVPHLAFIALYSLQPHKEWRFIIYGIPSLTTVAALGATRLWNTRSKNFLSRLASRALIASIIASFVISTSLLALSTLNYPGAIALHRLHALAHGSKSPITVHLDNLACSTGVTHFQELPPPPSTALLSDRRRPLWIYDRTEEEERLLNPFFWEPVDWAIVESPERVIGAWEIVNEVQGFAGVGVLKPGERSRNEDAVRGVLGDLVGEGLVEGLEQWARKSFTRAGWVGVRMDR